MDRFSQLLLFVLHSVYRALSMKGRMVYKVPSASKTCFVFVLWRNWGSSPTVAQLCIDIEYITTE
jgi:hypothetical protein